MSQDTTSQKELEIQVVNSNELNGFVGLWKKDNTLTVSFPIGYNLKDINLKGEESKIIEIKKLLKCLKFLNRAQEQTLSKDQENSSKNLFFPLSSFLYVLEQFLISNKKYLHEEDIIITHYNGGKIDFKKTIQIERPVISGNNLIYLNLLHRKNVKNHKELITKIHKYCVYEAIRNLGWFYNVSLSVIEKPNVKFHKSLFKSCLQQKLSKTQKDNEIVLLKCMLNIIENYDEENKSHWVYGTKEFEYIWERMIQSAFDNYEESTKEELKPKSLWTIEKPEEKRELASSLIPDSIMSSEGKWYILDAKYYKYGIDPSKRSNALPQTSDIVKQIAYGEYICHKKKLDAKNVFNAFLIPFDSRNECFNSNDNFFYIGKSGIKDFESSKPYEQVHAILIDIKWLIENYDKTDDSTRNDLANLIKSNTIIK
ncbi:LlaJI family restriction endonuclease [Mycoplasmopsis gallinacea]|uniref:LlaJI restriction endonuclease n=1 Tax=Mycoplasmopsis gallinacea TaxID=29556 RepID=A0A449A2B0_9BACT|nr:LlaJI family restriction endonuclease [Mycoplasmopsis gallinacea]VEU58323.1 LlaJI restriction endonuclease [Mycoplasmopsis gallinacea]